MQHRGTPYQAALADALARHVSAEAGLMARAPSALHSSKELHDLVTSAGFHNVRVCRRFETTTLPLPETFAPGHLAALPIAETITGLAPNRRAALIQDMTEALHAYVDGEQLKLPSGSHVVTANG